jgi:hypothetical protein
MSVDPSALNDVAAALWPMLVTGAAERAGGAGTDGAIQLLLAKIGRQRRERGLPAAPGSESELLDELRQLPSADPAVTGALQIVVNKFRGPVTMETGYFGIQNRA